MWPKQNYFECSIDELPGRQHLKFALASRAHYTVRLSSPA